MLILFPLTLIGVGFLIYALFASATLALPIGAGLAAGFGSAALGIAPLPSIVIGIAAFMGVIALGRFAAVSLSSRPARGMLIAVFAIPAAIAGFSVASAFASLAGFASFAVALVAGGLSGAVAAHRLADPVA
ncbi:hypothetical protein [Sphingomonas sp.]|uniref:hypothetical protein n=1 Tax=Sphingomonas sp. TaxID=28214 RepID=UPI003D6D03A1